MVSHNTAAVSMDLCRVLRLDAVARAKAYAGEVLVLRQLPSALELCERFRDLREKERGTFDRDASETSFDDRTRLCRAFEGNEGVRALFRRIFSEASVDAERTYWDRPRLRVQQSGGGYDDVSNSSKFGTGKYSSTLPPHRDTWASQLYQQLNWWLPLEEIEEGRTVCFYPDLFRVAVGNTSRSWDFDELRAKRKEGLPYPQLPELTPEALADLRSSSPPKPLLCDPGDVVIFSAAHLHASVANETGKTRYSCEIRSVDSVDFEEGVGAPNVDGEARCRPLHWFAALDDTKTKLGE